MGFKKFLRNNKDAFTLAEVVIVMGILSVMMVAFAPVISKRTVSNNAAFRNFRATEGHNGIYFGTPDDTKTVLIGNNFLTDTYNLTPELLLVNNLPVDPADVPGENDTQRASRLGESIVQPQIAFGSAINGTGLTTYGQLVVTADSVIIGGATTTSNIPNVLNELLIANKNTVIGSQACNDNASDTTLRTSKGNVCIGYNAGGPDTSQDGTQAPRIFIGDRTQKYTADHIFLGNKNLKEIISENISADASGNSGGSGSSATLTAEEIQSLKQILSSGFDISVARWAKYQYDHSGDQG